MPDERTDAIPQAAWEAGAEALAQHEGSGYLPSVVAAAQDVLAAAVEHLPGANWQTYADTYARNMKRQREANDELRTQRDEARVKAERLQERCEELTAQSSRWERLARELEGRRASVPDAERQDGPTEGEAAAILEGMSFAREAERERERADELQAERDEARAEAERLREALAKLDALIPDGEGRGHGIIAAALRASQPDAERPGGRHEWATSGDPETTCVRCGVPWQPDAERFPEREDHEAGIEAAAQAMLDNQGGRPAIEHARIVVNAYLSRVSAPSPERDTVSLASYERLYADWVTEREYSHARANALHAKLAEALMLLRAAHGEAVTHELHGKIGTFLAEFSDAPKDDEQ